MQTAPRGRGRPSPASLSPPAPETQAAGATGAGNEKDHPSEWEGLGAVCLPLHRPHRGSRHRTSMGFATRALCSPHLTSHALTPRNSHPRPSEPTPQPHTSSLPPGQQPALESPPESTHGPESWDDAHACTLSVGRDGLGGRQSGGQVRGRGSEQRVRSKNRPRLWHSSGPCSKWDGKPRKGFSDLA